MQALNIYLAMAAMYLVFAQVFINTKFSLGFHKKFELWANSRLAPMTIQQTTEHHKTTNKICSFKVPFHLAKFQLNTPSESY